jgi:hypothetical protein
LEIENRNPLVPNRLGEGVFKTLGFSSGDRVGTSRTFPQNSKNFFPASCTRHLTLLPLYAENLLSPSVVTRPLHGDVPTIDLVIGYNKSNMSALLKRFLSRVDEVVARVSQKGRR